MLHALFMDVSKKWLLLSKLLLLVVATFQEGLPICTLIFQLPTNLIPPGQNDVHIISSNGRLLPAGPLSHPASHMVMNHALQLPESIKGIIPLPSKSTAINDYKYVQSSEQNVCGFDLPSNFSIFPQGQLLQITGEATGFCSIFISQPPEWERQYLKAWIDMHESGRGFQCGQSLRFNRYKPTLVRGEFVGKGLHSKYHLTFPRPKKLQSRQRWGVLLYLPANTFVDPNEIHRWQFTINSQAEIPEDSSVYIHQVIPLGHIDLEVPDYHPDASPLIIAMEVSVNSAASQDKDEECIIKVPTHFRYHIPSINGEQTHTIEHVPPYASALGDCDSLPMTTHCLTNILDLVIDSLDPSAEALEPSDQEHMKLTWTVPVGNMNDRDWVQAGTFLSAGVGSLLIAVIAAYKRLNASAGTRSKR